MSVIVIAADTHKSTHSFCAVDYATGRVASERTLGADRAGMLQTLRWGEGSGEERVWALEDCRHVSSRVARDELRRVRELTRTANDLEAGGGGDRGGASLANITNNANAPAIAFALT